MSDVPDITPDQRQRIEHLLDRLAVDDPAALDDVVSHLYTELRNLAHHSLRGDRWRHTMGTTALVNETYMRLAGQRRLRPESRTHFFGIVSRTMRRVLVDYARSKSRQKRGGGESPVPLEDDMALTHEEADEIVALDAALVRLAGANERAATVVQHRYFVGLTADETAEAMGMSVRTVHREWQSARAWLLKEVRAELELE